MATLRTRVASGCSATLLIGSLWCCDSSAPPTAPGEAGGNAAEASGGTTSATGAAGGSGTESPPDAGPGIGGSGTGGSSQGQSNAGDTAAGGAVGIGGTTRVLDAGAPNAGSGGVEGVGGASTSGTAGSSGTPTTVGKFVGNITYRNQVDVAGFTFSQYWDQITPENAGKWGAVQSNASAEFKWSALDAIYGYAENNGLVFKQSSFVWGSQQPSGEITPSAVQKWMRAFCERFPHTKVIDVVYEPPPHTKPVYAEAIGGGTDTTWQWITNAFIWARAACPNAILLLNDYNIIEDTDENARIIGIIKTIKAAGAPIDAVGAEAIDVSKLPISFVKTLMDKLHTQTGLPLYITEYGVADPDDASQLRTYQEQFPILLNTDYVHGITLWGWNYDPVWADNYQSYLVKDGQFRPAMTWLMQQLRRPVP